MYIKKFEDFLGESISDNIQSYYLKLKSEGKTHEEALDNVVKKFKIDAEEAFDYVLDVMENEVKEGNDVTTLDMKEEALRISKEVIESFDHASSKLYDLKKMSDDIKIEFPALSNKILDIVEPMMIQLETDMPNKLNALVSKIK